MSVPVYIQAGYAWRKGARLRTDLDPNAIGREIAALRNAEGDVPVPAVVEAAEPESSAMHAHFTWDDSEAARKCREDEARYLLRSIVPIVVNTQTEDEAPSTRRVFIAKYQDDASQAGVYQMRTVQEMPAPVVARHWTEARREPTPAIEPPKQTTALLITSAPPALLDPRREKALTTLRTWADAYGSDPYFAGVVAAIRALG